MSEWRLRPAAKLHAAVSCAVLIRLCREEAAFKARIKTAQDTGGLAILQQDHIARTYLDTVNNVLERS